MDMWISGDPPVFRTSSTYNRKFNWPILTPIIIHVVLLPHDLMVSCLPAWNWDSSVVYCTRGSDSHPQYFSQGHFTKWDAVAMRILQAFLRSWNILPWPQSHVMFAISFFLLACTSNLSAYPSSHSLQYLSLFCIRKPSSLIWVNLKHHILPNPCQNHLWYGTLTEQIEYICLILHPYLFQIPSHIIHWTSIQLECSTRGIEKDSHLINHQAWRIVLAATI